ncbi:Lipase 2 [Leucoagaricus sp. SymC.cos]|nr:Lipase 2 [Leucoagaricus sp. SymC.cos]
MTDPPSRPQSRPSISNRLESLLSSRTGSPAPRSPHESPLSSFDSPTDFRRPRSAVLPDQSFAHPAPVLRWLSNWSPKNRGSQSGSESGSGSSSPSVSSPDLALLREALQEPLITPPPMAKLPPSFRPRNLARPPAFLDNLTRSTLPTSSLSPPLAVARSFGDVPLAELHSPPRRTSIDTLRRMSLPPSQTMSTTSTAESAPSSFLPGLPVTPNFLWWFSDSKESTSTSDLLSEEDRTQQLGKKYKSTINPVVFCHGLLGFDSVTIGPAIAPVQVTHWRGIKEVLEQNGTEVLITRVPATSSYVDRAKVLEERISQVYPGKGGLDCRYLTTHLKQRKFNILSITTIATPHRGSSFADHFLKTVGLERMPSVLALLDLLPNGGGDGKAFECLTIGAMKEFNEQTPDVDGVRYFSWGAVYEPGLIDTWKWPHSVILEKEGPNDGLVSIESAKWGTYLGTLNQVNHLDLVGWINTARYKWAEIIGKEIKFRPATFYLGIADMLAREVEGQTEGGEDQVETDESQRRSTEEEEREQMIHSLEDAGGELEPEGVHHTSTDLSPLVGPSGLARKTPSIVESKTSSGSATPRASSLLNAHSARASITTTGTSGSVTPRPLSRLESTSESSSLHSKERGS